MHLAYGNKTAKMKKEKKKKEKKKQKPEEKELIDMSHKVAFLASGEPPVTDVTAVANGVIFSVRKRRRRSKEFPLSLTTSLHPYLSCSWTRGGNLAMERRKSAIAEVHDAASSTAAIGDDSDDGQGGNWWLIFFASNNLASYSLIHSLTETQTHAFTWKRRSIISRRMIQLQVLLRAGGAKKEVINSPLQR